jgi:hypothetical protein
MTAEMRVDHSDHQTELQMELQMVLHWAEC